MTPSNKLIKGKKAGNDQQWLFCIPVQVGPPTTYAKHVLHWMYTVLVLQIALCALRILVLFDFRGGLWTALVVAIGWYASYLDMNITYICTWGLMCLVNGVFDVFGIILPFVFGLFEFNFLDTVLRIASAAAYLGGALLAYYIYHDYAKAHGLPVNKFDPFGTGDYEIEEATPFGNLAYAPQQIAGAGEVIAWTPEMEHASAPQKGVGASAQGAQTAAKMFANSAKKTREARDLVSGASRRGAQESQDKAAAMQQSASATASESRLRAEIAAQNAAAQSSTFANPFASIGAESQDQEEEEEDKFQEEVVAQNAAQSSAFSTNPFAIHNA